jgi:hypothetical protein
MCIKKFGIKDGKIKREASPKKWFASISSKHILDDLIASPKVKIVKGEGVGTCSLARNTSGVKGCAGVSRWN